jgi:hypothetical protein
MKSQRNNDRETISDWKGLYKLGSVSALLLVVIIVATGIVFAIEPQPLDGTALDWFMLFQNNPILGLVEFELLMIVYVIVSIPVVLSLYVLLRPVNPSWMTICLVLSLLGVMCFIAARPAFEMLWLSNGYAAATNEAERTIFLSAGQALVADFHGTAFHISYILGSFTGLIISFVMLQSNIFGKAFAFVRMAPAYATLGCTSRCLGSTSHALRLVPFGLEYHDCSSALAASKGARKKMYISLTRDRFQKHKCRFPDFQKIRSSELL